MSFMDQAHVDASSLFKAMSGISTNDQILIDVLCTATNEEIRDLQYAYAEG